ncbi:hypothetical protein HY994_04255 [Candidatus Micrarchaeota archaeon]|nr:hypothetical protein [Candidatus Micrarchaeota archaeon]
MQEQRKIKVAFTCGKGEQRSRLARYDAENAARKMGLEGRFDFWHGGVLKEKNGQYPFHKIGAGFDPIQIQPPTQQRLSDFDVVVPVAREAEIHLDRLQKGEQKNKPTLPRIVTPRRPKFREGETESDVFEELVRKINQPAG